MRRLTFTSPQIIPKSGGNRASFGLGRRKQNDTAANAAEKHEEV
jgi:hypothetical protein